MKAKDTIGRKRARSMSTSDLLGVLAKPYVRRLLETNGADVELVGRWLWICFIDQPDAQCHRFLSSVGFRFNRRRQLWQHSCGVRSVRSGGDPRAHYGSVPVNGVDADLLAAVA